MTTLLVEAIKIWWGVYWGDFFGNLFYCSEKGQGDRKLCKFIKMYSYVQ